MGQPSDWSWSDSAVGSSNNSTSDISTSTTGQHTVIADALYEFTCSATQTPDPPVPVSGSATYEVHGHEIDGPTTVAVGASATYHFIENGQDVSSSASWDVSGDPAGSLGSYTWDEPGEYTVAANNANGSARPITVTVTESAYTVTISDPGTIYVGENEDFSVSIEPATYTGNVQWTVRGADGSTATGTTGATEFFSHRFTETGSFTIIARLDSGEEDSRSVTVYSNIVSLSADPSIVLAGETVTFTATPPQDYQGSYEWSGDGIEGTETTTEATLTKSWTSTGTKTITVALPGAGGQSAPADVTVIDLEFVTPAGDPVDSGSSEPADGQNEFTFSKDSSILTVNFKVLVTPSGFAGEIADRITFDPGEISDSTLAWSEGNSGGAPTVDNDHLVASANFQTMPSSNSGFGTKTATVMFDGAEAKTQAYEVFFPAFGFNNPTGQLGTQIRNWYFYWNHTAAGEPSRNSDYLYDETMATQADFIGGRWQARIGPNAVAPGSPSTWGSPEGIDKFAWNLRHELKHVDQMSDFWGATTNVNGAQDGDNDSFPTEREPTYMTGSPYDPENPTTFRDDVDYGVDPIPDQEDICMRTQSAAPHLVDILWTNGSANAEDWAEPGMQHNTLNDPND